MLFNVHAGVRTTHGINGAMAGLHIVAPVKGQGQLTTTIERGAGEERFDRLRRAVLTAVLEQCAHGDFWMRATAEEREFLASSGLFVAPSAMPEAVAVPAGLTGGFFNLDAVGVERALVVAARDLRDRGFAIVNAMASGPALRALRVYYRAVIAAGFAAASRDPDGRVRRWTLHNDPAARALHPLLRAPVSAMAGTAMKPSYAYLLAYREGASLPPHTDREPCEITAMIQVDFEPEPRGLAPWPLVFDTVAGPEPIVLALGDAVIFRGREVGHYRDELTCGRSSTSLAFHFVTESFEGLLD